MASGDFVRYVITVMLHEDTLTEINELRITWTRDWFLLTMTDDEGNIHELGTNTFGLISTQSEEEIRELVSGLPKVQPARIPEITITTWEEWNSNRK
ncbi:type V toxin-antitoxin system endoribonuclease antitoxin GhoS [Escherichia coli]